MRRAADRREAVPKRPQVREAHAVAARYERIANP